MKGPRAVRKADEGRTPQNIKLLAKTLQETIKVLEGAKQKHSNGKWIEERHCNLRE